MAAYTVAAGERGTHAHALVAATADTVTFTDDVDQVEVYSLWHARRSGERRLS